MHTLLPHPTLQLGSLEDCDKGVVAVALGSLKELLGGLGAQPMLPWLEQVRDCLPGQFAVCVYARVCVRAHVCACSHVQCLPSDSMGAHAALAGAGTLL